jgi:hypothetical protein
MSWGAWGDDDPKDVPEGWWTDVTVQVVQECIRDLLAEPIYEDRQMAKGISVRFLARLSILQGEAGLMSTKDPMYIDAERILCEPKA